MNIRTLWEHRAPDNGGGRPVAYDDERGEIIHDQPLAPRTGDACWAGGTLLGLHVEGNKLLLQIGPDKFDLDAPDVRATKENNYRDGTILFQISQGNRTRSLLYKGWWVGIIHPPEGVGGLPEMDEDEDLLGWIYRLLESADRRERQKAALLEPRTE